MEVYLYGKMLYLRKGRNFRSQCVSLRAQDFQSLETQYQKSPR